MQAMTPYVDQLSRGPELPAMPSGGDRLIDGADRNERHDNSKNGHRSSSVVGLSTRVST
jgi:hypothetical protein